MDERHMKKLRRLLTGAMKSAVYVAALLFALQVAVAVFGIPPRFQTWITAREEALELPPATIVVLGGGGIPSESGLIRSYYGAEAARAHPGARVIVSLPTDADPETSSVGRMRDELVLRGVPTDSILMEYRGRNTYQQAVAVRKMLDTRSTEEPLLIVTSPSHARRSVLCFEKAGFRDVGCLTADNTFHEADIGAGGAVRYNVWATLTRLVEYTRELVAMAYYRFRGWI